jgi:alpha-tubulin suppressor-like RCC1 family protein
LAATRNAVRAGAVKRLRAVAIAAGRCYTLAVLRNGDVASWGCGVLGRRGDKARPGRVEVLGAGRKAGRAAAVAAGEWAAVAITKDGKVG